MSRRKKHPAHANHERWLVSYADFITLLFAFFVVLYASSQTDSKKVQQVAAAVQAGYQQMGVFSGTAPGAMVRSDSAPPSGSISPPLPGPQVARLVTDLSPNGNGKEHSGGGGIPASELKKQLEEVLRKELHDQHLDLRMTPDGLVVSLREIGFFNSGEAVLLPQAEPTLAHVASALAAHNFEVRVEGHTDDKPIHTAQYRSNWDLSTARATEVVNMLVGKYNFNPERISVAGYAQYRPVASNETEEGRRKNRRIDLVIVSTAPPTNGPPAGAQALQADSPSPNPPTTPPKNSDN